MWCLYFIEMMLLTFAGILRIMRQDYEVRFCYGGIMSLIGLLLLLAIASICGSIGTGLAGYSSRGCLTNIVLGFGGAMIGTWLSGELGMPILIEFMGIPIVWSIIGAALFVAVLGAITGRGQRRRD